MRPLSSSLIRIPSSVDGSNGGRSSQSCTEIVGPKESERVQTTLALETLAKSPDVAIGPNLSVLGPDSRRFDNNQAEFGIWKPSRPPAILPPKRPRQIVPDSGQDYAPGNHYPPKGGIRRREYALSAQLGQGVNLGPARDDERPEKPASLILVLVRLKPLSFDARNLPRPDCRHAGQPLL